MAKELKKYIVVLDGIDKCGKDTLIPYIFDMSNKQYLIVSRGIQSLIAYNDLYNRGFSYDLSEISKMPALHVFLRVDHDDWLIRCKKSNEPYIDFEDNVRAFENAAKVMRENEIDVLEINTSLFTPIETAARIVDVMNFANEVSQ